MRKSVIILLLMISGLLGFTLSLYLHSGRDQESQQIAEAVNQTFHNPTAFVKQVKNDPDAGRKIFKEFCSVCHSNTPAIDVNAPRIGDKKAWKEFKLLGMPALLKTTIHGQGAMPARGGCFECSDDQLRETIQYILNANSN